MLRYDRHTVHLEFPGQVPLRGDFLAEVMPTMEILYSDEASSPSEAASQQATPTVTVNTAQVCCCCCCRHVGHSIACIALDQGTLTCVDLTLTLTK